MNKRKKDKGNDERELLIAEIQECEYKEIIEKKKKPRTSHDQSAVLANDSLIMKENERKNRFEIIEEPMGFVDIKERLAQQIVNYCIENNYDINQNNFFEELASAELIREGKVLQIGPLEANLGGLTRFPREVFIQDQYKDVYMIIQELFSKSRSQKCWDFIVLGNPGIGKTIFGLYYMWKIVTSEKSFFMYEFQMEKIRLFLPGLLISLNRTQAHELCEAFPFQIIYLVDFIEKNYEPLGGIPYKYAVCFTSPNPSRYLSFAKGDRAKIIYMKRPEIEEVKEMWRNLSEFNEIEEKVIDQQIKWYGPIPRYVLLCTKHGKTLLKNFLDSNGRFFCQILFQRYFSLIGNDEYSSHLLIHMDSKDHLDCCYRAASKYVVKKVLRQYRAQLLLSLMRYISFQSGVLNSLAKDVLDILAPRELLPGKVHTLRPLFQSGERINASETTEGINLHLIETKKLPDNWNTDDSFTPAQNVYYTQSSKIAKDIDGFAIEKSSLFLFQITFFKKAFITRGTGLSETIKNIQGKYREQQLRVLLIFVTGSSHTTTKRIKTIQPFCNDERNNYFSNEDMPKRIRGLALEQYVLQLSDSL